MMNLSTRSALAAALIFPALMLLGSALSQSPTVLPLPSRDGTRGPAALVFRPDGKQLYVAEQDENDVAVLDSETGQALAHIPTGGAQPTALALTPDGKVLVATNLLSGSVGLLDVEKRTLKAQVPLLGEPSGVVVTSDGRAFVSLGQLDQVAVIDITRAKVTQRIPVGRAPRVLALAPDGRTLVCANSLGGSLSLIDITTNKERKRVPLPAINLRGLAFAPDGLHVWVTGQQPHNDLSTERPETLWSNVLCEVSLAGKTQDGRQKTEEKPSAFGEVVERMLVLDRAEYGAADPGGIALDAKGEIAFVTLSGTHEVAVVPLPGNNAGPKTSVQNSEPTSTPPTSTTVKTAGLEGKAGLKMTFKSDGGEINPQLPVAQVGDSVRRIHVGCNPRALALRPHTPELWVGNHLGNSLTVLPASSLQPNAAKATAAKVSEAKSEAQTDEAAVKPLRLVGMGMPTPSPNHRLKGRFFFASAHVTRGQFFSCESCHPNGNTDGLSWKFAHVKDGMEARNTKNLRGLLLLTAPYGWGGREDDFEVFVHDEVGGLLKTRKLEHPEVHALWDLVNETPLPPNPYRNPDGSLTPAAMRGKVLFTGQGGCVNCHVGEMHGGTKKRESIGTTPKDVTIDVPHLVGAYESAPYLHDGRAATLEEIFTKYNPEKLHGNADSLTPAQLKDLLEYVREL